MSTDRTKLRRVLPGARTAHGRGPVDGSGDNVKRRPQDRYSKACAETETKKIEVKEAA